MADLHPYEDQAVLYLLDRLPADERREFETRLAESAELRALLRELEDGSAALAMTAPRRRPPAQIWKRIETAVNQERERETDAPVFWLRWWRWGWAAAAVLLAGWLFHALWMHRAPSASEASSAQAKHPREATPDAARNLATAHEAGNPLPPQAESAHTALMIAGLRHQITDLSNHLTQLSQSVAHQQALLLETNRLKFFQLTTDPDRSAATNAPVSPGLQRALFIAMARELGWLSSGSNPDLALTGSFPVIQPDQRLPSASNIAGVDFVDLRSGSNAVVHPPLQTDTQRGGNLPEPDPLTTAAAGGVPGFISGTNAVLAFDGSVVAPGSRLTFWSSASGEWYQLIGSSVLGNHPMVVTVPFSAGAGATLTVTAGNDSGSSNILGQFPPSPGGP